jgi:hypothetical protein
MEFEIGQLVKNRNTGDIGLVERVDRDYYGARQAFKVYDAKRGQALRPSSVNGIGPTKDGIRDRVLVLWLTDMTANGDGLGRFYQDGKDIYVLEAQNGV